MPIIATWKTFSAYIATGLGSTSKNTEPSAVPTKQLTSLSWKIRN